MIRPRRHCIRLTLDETASQVLLEVAEARGQSPERVASGAVRLAGMVFAIHSLNGVVRDVGNPREAGA